MALADLPYRFADLGDNLAIGSATACAIHADTFPRRVHVWRGRDRDLGDTCRFFPAGDPCGLLVYWREGDPVEKMDRPFAEVMDYLTVDEPTFIHCRGSVCRSAVLAVAAKVARGRDVWEASAEVARAVWEGYREAVWLEPHMMRGVIEWAEANRRAATG